MASRVVVESEHFVRRAAEDVAGALSAAAARAPEVALCLSGGTTPRTVYRELARIPNLPWSRVRVFFGDERAVPPAHPDSNYGMVRAVLFDELEAAPLAVHRMPADADDLEAAALEYEAVVPGAFDLLLLGIGEDGHTASLFPRAAVLSERVRRVVAVDGPKPPRRRLTITPRVLAEARTTIVLASGAAKARAVAAALEGPEDAVNCPASLVRHGLWILDRDAARLLRT